MAICGRWSGALESTAGEEEEENEEFSKWAEEVEAEEVEYQVPGDDLDNDSIFDNRIATQVAPGILMVSGHAYLARTECRTE